MADNPRDSRHLRALRQGDFEVFERVYNAYVRRLASFFYRLCWNESDTEFLTQECFIQLWKGALIIDDEEPLVRVLYRIAKNVYVEFERHRRRRDREEGVTLDAGGAEHRVSARVMARVSSVEADDKRRRLQESREFRQASNVALAHAMRQVDTGSRMVFVLLVYQGLKCEEIAAILGSDVERTRQRACRAENVINRFLVRWMEAA